MLRSCVGLFAKNFDKGVLDIRSDRELSISIGGLSFTYYQGDGIDDITIE